MITSCIDNKTKEHSHEHNPDGTHKLEQVNNIVSIVVKANKNLEYKFKIDKDEKLEYKWISNAPLYYDFHGDPENKENFPKNYDESYAIGNSNSVKGKITIPYIGSHGWYWKNESDKDITIKLFTKGKYSVIGIVNLGS
ncbi:hypothetical protein GCM10022397_27020 [Flavivirga jejuensis]